MHVLEKNCKSFRGKREAATPVSRRTAKASGIREKRQHLAELETAVAEERFTTLRLGVWKISSGSNRSNVCSDSRNGVSRKSEWVY
ncbi:hypothetical protein KI387_002616, partial [Taxus chinensis]